jgi:adenine/guanine phosphoribosyltransferase-like PRPP-binding protein
MSEDKVPGRQPWKGLDTSRMPVFIGYDQVERMVAALLEPASAWRPDEVVGISRGGLVPAAMAAGILALPLTFVSHERATGAVTWIGRPAAGRRILLVDDCCSSGNTLHRAREALIAEGRECLTLVVVHDPDVAQHLPDLSHPMRELFRLPWERGEATPTGRAAKASGETGDLAAETPFVGVGLGEALLAAIVARAGIGQLPRFPLERSVFICDFASPERVGAMLASTQYGQVPLVCCQAAIVEDRAAVTRWKAETATRNGCTHFIECDAEQAIGISAQAPHLIVTWWQEGAGVGWTVGAAAQTVFPLSPRRSGGSGV